MEQLFTMPLPLAAMQTMEWVIILAVVLLLFGARKLPALAESMGASISSFKKGMKQSQENGASSDAKGAADAKRPAEREADSKH